MQRPVMFRRFFALFAILASHFVAFEICAQANFDEIEYNQRLSEFNANLKSGHFDLNDVLYPIPDLQQHRLNELAEIREAQITPIEGDLSKAQKKSIIQQELDTRNRADLHRVNLSWFDEVDTERAQYMPKSAAQKILRYVSRHPNVGNLANIRYDWFGKIGFCFGRGFAVHIASLYSGLHKRSIKKVFAVGDMGGWTFHVATMVKAYEGGWWVIDPIMDDVMTLEEWTAYFRNGYKKAQIRFYFTEGSRLTTRVTEYSRGQLGLDQKRFKDAYRGYFKDFLRAIRNPRRRRKLPQLSPEEYSRPIYRPVDFSNVQTVFKPIFTNNQNQLFSGKHACEINFRLLSE